MTKKKSLSVELLVQIWWKVVGDRRNEIDKNIDKWSTESTYQSFCFGVCEIFTI